MIHIYGTPTCSYCSKAKAFLDARQIPYEYFTIGQDISMTEAKEIVPEGWKTVPVIFSNNNFIGGYDQLVQLIEDTANGFTDDI